MLPRTTTFLGLVHVISDFVVVREILSGRAGQTVAWRGVAWRGAECCRPDCLGIQPRKPITASGPIGVHRDTQSVGVSQPSKEWQPQGKDQGKGRAGEGGGGNKEGEWRGREGKADYDQERRSA